MKAPLTIYKTWEELDAAVHSVMRHLDNETLAFLASENVSEVNGLISDAARDEEQRRADGE